MNTRLRLPARWALLTAALATGIAAFLGCSTDYSSFGLGNGFLDSGVTLSFFKAIQIDPKSEDSAGPQFVEAADLNGDGLVDLVSVWSQSQPVQIHLQSRSGTAITFETVTLAGSIGVMNVAGLAVDDYDLDGRADIAVLVKESLTSGAACLDSEQPGEGLNGLVLLFLGPANSTQANQALAWEEVPVSAAFLQGAGSAAGLPEEGGFTSMKTGDMDLDGDIDIVVAWNSDCGEGIRDAVIFDNRGSGAVRDGTWNGTRIPDSNPKGSAIKDIALADVDLDGDLDIIASYPDAATMNVRWYRNPAVDVPDDFHFSGGGWQTGFIGQVATGADTLRAGDVDGDGLLDVVVRSTAGGVIQWFRGPAGATTAPLRSIPWQIYTLAEFPDRTPLAISLGDLNNDGQLDLIASAEGAVAWFDATAADSVYDQWIGNLIVDETSSGESPATTDPNVSPDDVAGGTIIHSIVVKDLDGDGENDVLATLDRDGLSGLTNDALTWFRNTRGD